ncbi:hypothetical protein CTAYLR_003873 [Chrysophaeum taylorii]|uniref:Uncharacterized protein n=1 Tax=Chrysophaeum taylorii TaxID=2483200 RepID=A0AAD7UKE5_9STRA|nr:hypothetical protein CTAYLR_003873 [Chrysophaeum taylorii]
MKEDFSLLYHEATFDKERLEIFSESAGLRARLRLGRDASFFSPGYREIRVTQSQGFEVTSGVAPRIDCFQNGTIHANATDEIIGRVRASLCGSDRLILWMRDRRILEVISREDDDVFVVVDHGDRASAFLCGVEAPQAHRRRLSSSECALRPDKSVEVVIFNDHSRSREDVEVQTAAIFSVVRDIYASGLYDPEIFPCHVEPRLVGQVTFRDGDPAALAYARGDDCAACGDECARNEVSVSCLLESFQEYALVTHREEFEAIFDAHLDNVHLLSARDFSSSMVGYAGVSSACSTESAGVEQATSSSLVFVAAVVAHEMGHNLGMAHDEYLMSPWIDGTDVRFSDASKEDAARFFDDVYGVVVDACLENDDPDATWDVPRCGDGRVDDGEECDAGVDDDPCCGRPLTANACALLDGCACAKSDACCEDGAIVAAGTICRVAAHAECDYVEVCDGAKSECPHDFFVAAGTACTDVVVDGTPASGKCFKGDCLSGSDDCTWSDVYVYDCERASSCATAYCRSTGDDGATTPCYTRLEPATDGIPCSEDGVDGQCIATKLSFQEDAAAAAASAFMECVDSSTIKFYHWDHCDCYDEEGTLVEVEFCADVENFSFFSSSSEENCDPPTPAPPTSRPSLTLQPSTAIPTPAPTIACATCCSEVSGLAGRYGWGTFYRLDGACCSDYCSYQEPTYGMYLQYSRSWDTYFVSSSEPCFAGINLVYYDAFDPSSVSCSNDQLEPRDAADFACVRDGAECRDDNDSSVPCCSSGFSCHRRDTSFAACDRDCPRGWQCGDDDDDAGDNYLASYTLSLFIAAILLFALLGALLGFVFCKRDQAIARRRRSSTKIPSIIQMTEIDSSAMSPSDSDTDAPAISKPLPADDTENPMIARLDCDFEIPMISDTISPPPIDDTSTSMI